LRAAPISPPTFAASGCAWLKPPQEFDPADRITAEESLGHPYLQGLRCPEDEPANKPFSYENCQFERAELSMREIRKEILVEVAFYERGQAKSEEEDELREAAETTTGAGGERSDSLSPQRLEDQLSSAE